MYRKQEHVIFVNEHSRCVTRRSDGDGRDGRRIQWRQGKRGGGAERGGGRREDRRRIGRREGRGIVRGGECGGGGGGRGR